MSKEWRLGLFGVTLPEKQPPGGTMVATAAHDVSVSQELSLRLSDARRRTDELFGLVRPDSLYERPIPERHRIIFYIGHLEAFDWNLLGGRVFGLESFQPEFDRLFAFGIDPVGGGLPDDQPTDWPARQRVHEYAGKVRQLLDQRLGQDVLPAGADGFPIATLLQVAIEHRLMHAETLAYMLHQLPLHRKNRPTQKRPAISTEPVQPAMIEIPAGAATLGLERSSGMFGWDNEYEAHTASVPAFAIDLVQHAQTLVDSRQGIGAHAVVIDAEIESAAIHLAAQRIGDVHKLPLGSVIRAHNLQATLMMSVAPVAMLAAVVALVVFATLVPIVGIKFQPGHTTLRIVVFFDIAIPFAQPYDENFVHVRYGIDAEIEARHLELQYAIVDESPDTARYVHHVSWSSPVSRNQFTALRQRGTCQQQQTRQTCTQPQARFHQEFSLLLKS